MKTPRGVSGDEIVKALSKVSYYKIRQVGSHVRLETIVNGRHRVTVTIMDSTPVGSLSSLLEDVSKHLRISKEELTTKLFDQ